MVSFLPRNLASKALTDVSIPQVATLALRVSTLSRPIAGSRAYISNLHHPSRTVADNQVHDWLVFLDCEVEHIWRKGWSVGKILFIITRYGPFLDMLTTVTSELDPCTVGIEEMLTSDPTACSAHRSAWHNRR